MRYFPHTEEDIASMLNVIKQPGLDALFTSIPEDCRLSDKLNLPHALTEWELKKFMETLAQSTASSHDYKVFIGAGSYSHYIPSIIPYLLGRSEFVTAYTPYQPEMSQGTLQAIYEYQTLTARLLGMEIANASLYDGASALAEALLMAIRITKRNKVAISNLVHPLYRRVIKTYFSATDYEIIEIPYFPDGRTDISYLPEAKSLAAIAIQSPNFFGCIENLQQAANIAHEGNALLITSFTEALAYGLLATPGKLGADIACGEGQSFGIPQSFGGPSLGMFATASKYVRNIPGRLVGKTIDNEGSVGFVLTLATREQHIRREKATSNICTNNSLCALAATIFMASLGGTGFHKLAQLNHDKAEYLKKNLTRAGFTAPFKSPSFNEFVVEAPEGFSQIYRRLMEKKVIAGLHLASYYPELTNHYLFCATETASKEDIDLLIKEVQ